MLSINQILSMRLKLAIIFSIIESMEDYVVGILPKSSCS